MMDVEWLMVRGESTFGAVKAAEQRLIATASQVNVAEQRLKAAEQQVNCDDSQVNVAEQRLIYLIVSFGVLTTCE